MPAPLELLDDILTTPAGPGGDWGPRFPIDLQFTGLHARLNFDPLRAIQTGRYASGPSLAAPEIFPTVRVITPDEATGLPRPADTWDEAVDVEEGDPETDRQTGLPESSPGGPILVPSVLDYPPDYPYGVIPPIPDDANVAIDWGSVFGGVAESYVTARYAPSPVRGLVAGPAVAAQPSQSGFINQYTAPAGPVMAGGNGCATCPTGSPRYSKICNATGEVSPLRRRRRRRLLTAGDLSDIASLKAIVGGGAALNAAVVKAMK